MSWFGKDEEDVIEVPEKKDPNAWELLDDDEDFYTWRRRVPGGWLIRTEQSSVASEGLTFFPDADHSWRP